MPKPIPKPVPDDPVLRAHLRRQRDWAADAPELMAGPTAQEQKRAALLAALDRRDNEQRKEKPGAPRKRTGRKPGPKPGPKPGAKAGPAIKSKSQTTNAKD